MGSVYEKNAKPVPGNSTQSAKRCRIPCQWRSPYGDSVHEIAHFIPKENIIHLAYQRKWDNKPGNIAPNEVILMETLRLGLAGDTFSNFPAYCPQNPT